MTGITAVMTAADLSSEPVSVEQQTEVKDKDAMLEQLVYIVNLPRSFTD